MTNRYSQAEIWVSRRGLNTMHGRTLNRAECKLRAEKHIVSTHHTCPEEMFLSVHFLQFFRILNSAMYGRLFSSAYLDVFVYVVLVTCMQRKSQIR